jgi:hypothetical protein
MSTVTFANGQTLNSSALTQTQIENTFQVLTTSILGEGTDPNSAVRISWPTGGAPGWDITDDVIFLKATITNDRVNRSRDRGHSNPSDGSLTETVTYIRVWKIDFLLYGPNSLDHARLIKSALYMDWTQTTLAASNMAVVLDVADPRRMPELFEGQWWERSDFSARFNELVTETTTVAAIASIEIDLYTEDTSVSQPVREIDVAP